MRNYTTTIIPELMRRAKRPGWRWDKAIEGLRNSKLGLLVRSQDLSGFELENERELEIALMGIEAGATARWHGADPEGDLSGSRAPSTELG